MPAMWNLRVDSSQSGGVGKRLVLGDPDNLEGGGLPKASITERPYKVHDTSYRCLASATIT